MNRGYSRKRKLVRLDLQFKVVFITLFVTSLVLLINFQLNLAGMWGLASRFQDNPQARALIDAFRTATIQKFLLSVGMAVPLAASVGVLYSFKFCGPIFRFKKFFVNMTSCWDEPLKLRKGDDMQDVCDAINAGVGSMRAQLRLNYALLEDVDAFLRSTGASADEDQVEWRNRLALEIREQNERFRSRFPTEFPPPASPTSESSDDSAESDRESVETAGASA
jgi:hypothetical protein